MHTLKNHSKTIYKNAINRVDWIKQFTTIKEYLQELKKYKCLYILRSKSNFYSDNVKVLLDKDNKTILHAIKH